MKRITKPLLLILVLFTFLSIGISVDAVDSNQMRVEITSTSTLDNDVECATAFDKNYCVLKGNTIRIKYVVYNTEKDASAFFSEMYGTIVGHESTFIDNTYTGYYDITLKLATEIIVLLGINNETTQALIAFDSIDLVVFDKVESLAINTINPVGFLNKTLIFNVLVNNDETLYISDLYIYYIDKNGDKIELINNFSKDNYFTVTIDENLTEYESIDFYLSNDEVTSAPLRISMIDVTYLEYVDIVDSDVTYCITDDVVDFYARIPLNSNPDFVLIDNSNTVRLQSYSILHNSETFDTVCFKIKLLDIGSTNCLLGFLSYSNSSDASYTYKNIELSVIESVTSIAFDEYSDDITYGSTILFTPIINDVKDISCQIKWYLDNELIYTGPTLNYAFYNSGNHELRMEYNGLEANVGLYVEFSANESLIWYSAFVVIFFAGIIVLFRFFRVKKTPLSKIANKSDEIQADLAKMLKTNEKKMVSSIIRKVTIFEHNIEIINDSYDYLSIDSTIDILKSLLADLTRLKANKQDKPKKYRKSIEKAILDLNSSFSKRNMDLLMQSQTEEE